jgi:RimJ/RimL family protein N-acetyltransferase
MATPLLPLSPPVPNISTARLELVAITPETMRSELAMDGRLGELLQCRVTSEWPHADWEPHVFELMLKVFEERPEEIGWHRYILLRSDPDGKPVLIGSTGGFRWPADRSSAEVGYAIIPEFRLRGYAIEAAKAMFAWIEATGEVEHIFAHTFPELTGSIRILERCGFVLEGPGAEPGTVRYIKR